MQPGPHDILENHGIEALADICSTNVQGRLPPARSRVALVKESTEKHIEG